MKTTIITFFAAAATLFAAETNTVAPTSVPNVAPVFQAELVEQARFVAEIAREASQGFDSETHARSLRAQIEALVYKPVPAKGGAHIDTTVHKTRFPEQLRADEFEKHLVEIVRRYHETTGEYAVQVVIHRDGRMFESELKGAKRGLQRLKADGFIAPHASLTAVEIGKHSAISVRLFALHQRTATDIQAENPTIGDYFIPNDTEGYLVSTGYPFAREGTVLPLHVRKVEGPLSMEPLLEDLFWLTTLAWSRPEGCSRYPIDIKMNDRRLFEDAGQYDENEVELYEQEAEL